MKRTLKTVKAVDVRIDGDTQQRDSIDPHWVHELVDLMKNDVQLPPLQVRFDGAAYWLSDGFHRYHAFMQLGIKNIEVAYLPGTQHDAQIDSYSANHDHGKQRSRADKIKAVQSALKNPYVKDKSDAEIARICKVSKPFVAAVRKPEQKKKQEEARQRNTVKKAGKIQSEKVSKKSSQSNQITSDAKLTEPTEGAEPEEQELLLAEKKLEADRELLAEFLDADDKMDFLYKENTRLKHENVSLSLRIKELMNEKNAAIDMVKDLQNKLKKVK